MSIVLILFFGSLVAMTIMVARKMSSLKEIQNQNTEEFLLAVPDLEEIKHIAWKKTKRYSYNVLVITLRLYILSSYFVKKKSKELYVKAKNRLHRNKNRQAGDLGEKREVSGFLKRISEYKEKIKTIKHRIKEEENIE